MITRIKLAEIFPPLHFRFGKVRQTRVRERERKMRENLHLYLYAHVDYLKINAIAQKRYLSCLQPATLLSDYYHTRDIL